MRNRFFFILLTLFTAPATCFGQFAAIDSARQRVYQAATDEERLQALSGIGRFANSLHGDSIYLYAVWQKKLAGQLHNYKQLAQAEYSLLSADLAKGKADSVIYKINQSGLFTATKKTDKALYYKIQLLKANALNRVDNRVAALELQLNLLNEAEKDGNLAVRLFALNYIGATYLNLGKAAEAKQAWLSGLHLISEHPSAGNDEIEAYIYSNLALLYFNNFYITRARLTGDSFLIYINRGVALSEDHNYLGSLASSLALRGNYYGIVQQFNEGEKDLKKGLAIRNKIGDPYYIVNDIGGLSSFYYSHQQYKNCVESAAAGVRLANSNGVGGHELVSLYGIMAAAYKASGDYVKYSKTLERYIAVTDSGNRINAAEKIAEIQTRYETQKKETLIAQQALELFRRKLVIYGGAVVALFAAALLVYRFRRYKHRQKIALAAIMEEKKLQHELALKEAEETERKRIAAELHDNLGVQANAILHNSILLSNQKANHNNVVADLQETAREMLLNLRETLWAMRTADVTAISLWLRVINFMKQMGRHYTTIDFNVEGEAPEALVLNATRALNIVLVVQETVNNAVKHAAASCITVISKRGKDRWEIQIQDNGAGFDMETAIKKTDSYGLRNIRERAAAVHFGYSIETAPGKGTIAGVVIVDGNYPFGPLDY